MQSDTIYSLLGRPVSTIELLIGGAVLLFLAGVLLIFSRRQRVALDRSWTTDELMLHLSRIADSLDRLASRPPDHVIVQAPTQADATATEPKTAEGPRTIPYSIFGREISPSH